MRTTKYILIPGLALFVLFAFTYTPQSEKWVVPANFKTMKNPVAKSGESLEIGEELYMQHCKSCHGKEGLGDGPKAADQKGDLGDFSDAKFQAQTDGELFYKTKEGRDDMPGFAKKIPDNEDLWSVVYFIRTLKQ